MSFRKHFFDDRLHSLQCSKVMDERHLSCRKRFELCHSEDQGDMARHRTISLVLRSLPKPYPGTFKLGVVGWGGL